MTQSASVRPEPNFQRKAAVANAGGRDHADAVQVRPIPDFDLDRTIFQTLRGRTARFVIKNRVGKEVRWNEDAAERVQQAYERVQEPLPEVSPELLDFMVSECDFDVEHADGSFLDHLYFCYEYGVLHYPERSPLVLLLHSILGTGTNTFAMEARHIPTLKGLLSPFDWTHTEAFPSALRLLYLPEFRQQLASRPPDQLRAARFHRVIDNAPIELSGEDLWVQLNYQLVHLVDFLPVANWTSHFNDTSFILFRELHALLEGNGTLEARVGYQPPAGPRRLAGETRSFGGWFADHIPVSVSASMATRSVKSFSQDIGHSLDFELQWG